MVFLKGALQAEWDQYFGPLDLLMLLELIDWVVLLYLLLVVLELSMVWVLVLMLVLVLVFLMIRIPQMVLLHIMGIWYF